MGLKALAGILRAAVVGFIHDRAMSMGAAMAYYTLFSLAPVLVIVIAVAGMVFGREAAQGAIVNELADLLGADGARAVEAMIASAGQTGSGVLAAIVGIVAFLLGATTAFIELQESLNTIWRAPPAWGSIVLTLLRDRLLSLAVVLGLGFLLLVSLVIGAGITAFAQLIDRWAPGLSFLMGVVNFAVSFVVTTLLFAFIYKVLPRVEILWRDVLAGAVLAALLFMLGRWAIAFYIGQTRLASSYGAASTVILVMVWVYYSSQILFLGAEFSRAWCLHRAARRAAAAGITPPAA
ncbi:MAG: YihY/virulence factor BrkB family protein [Rhodospirillaceae bacterium]|nr:YihY/virulence factor BrkB family protein [Rhodospirillaceae bacterium]